MTIILLTWYHQRYVPAPKLELYFLIWENLILRARRKNKSKLWFLFWRNNVYLAYSSPLFYSMLRILRFQNRLEIICNYSFRQISLPFFLSIWLSNCCALFKASKTIAVPPAYWEEMSLLKPFKKISMFIRKF